MTDDAFLDGLRQAIEMILDRVYVTDRADSAVAAAREGVSLEGYAACLVTAKLVGAVDRLITDVQDGKRREPFF